MIIDCAAYVDGVRQGASLELGSVSEWLDRPGAFVWLGLRMPNHEELRAVCEAFGLSGVDVEEVLAPHRRPVLTVQDGVSWLVLRTAEYVDARETVSLGEISVLTGNRFVISIRHGQAAWVRAGPLPAALLAIVALARTAPLDGFEKDAIEIEREVLSESRHRPVRRLLNLSRQVRELQLVIEALEDRVGRHRH